MISCIHTGLELKSESMYEVLTKAGIKDWNGIARELKLDEGWMERMMTKLNSINIFKKKKAPTDVVNDLLMKWPKPRSWEELARVIENISFEIAQKTRELSESGRWLTIRLPCISN